MPKSKNNRIKKLRQYRDSLIRDIATKTKECEQYKGIIFDAYKAMTKNDPLTALALLSERRKPPPLEVLQKEEMLAELVVMYEFYTVLIRVANEMQYAARRRDLLRVTALAAEMEVLVVEQSRHIQQLQVYRKNLVAFTSD